MVNKPLTLQNPHPSFQLLAAVRLPGRLNAEQTAIVLGFAPHDIPVLVKANLLKQLGKPAQSAVKFFAAVEVLALAEDRDWLAKATNAIYGKWAQENGRRRQGAVKSAPAARIAA